MDKHKDLPTGPKPPKIVTVVVEATRNSKNRYNVTGMFTRLENMICTPIPYPREFGFIPRTALDDSVPLTAMILTEYPTLPGCLVDAIPIGILRFTENGIRKDLILTVPVNDPEYGETRDVSGVSKHALKEIEEFFRTYKAPKKNDIKIIGWADAKEAERTIVHSMKMYGIKKD
ncbi:MAG: inorganic diphosphatase [archaeon]